MKRARVLVGMVLLTVVLSVMIVLGNLGAATAQTSPRYKICSVIVDGNWRDTIWIPQGWGSSTCRSFRDSVGADTFQLGCLLANSFSWGSTNGGIPRNNCGWQ